MHRQWFAFRGGPALTGWRLALGSVFGVALVAGVIALALAAFVVVLPLVAALALWGRWRLRKAMREAAQNPASDIIDVDYVVLPPSDRLGRR